MGRVQVREERGQKTVASKWGAGEGTDARDC